MEQRTDRLYPSARLEKNALERKLEKKLNVVNTLKHSIINIKEMIIHFKHKNHKSKKRYKKYKTFNTKLESVDTIVKNGATSTSIPLSITGIGSTVLSISAGFACDLSLAKKVLQKIISNKYIKYKKQYHKNQETVETFDKLYRKSLQDKIKDKKEYESLRNIFNKYLDETRNEFL